MSAKVYRWIPWEIPWLHFYHCCKNRHILFWRSTFSNTMVPSICSYILVRQLELLKAPAASNKHPHPHQAGSAAESLRRTNCWVCARAGSVSLRPWLQTWWLLVYRHTPNCPGCMSWIFRVADNPSGISAENRSLKWSAFSKGNVL
jgi:hypothetical protein